MATDLHRKITQKCTVTIRDIETASVPTFGIRSYLAERIGSPTRDLLTQRLTI